MVGDMHTKPERRYSNGYTKLERYRMHQMTVGDISIGKARGEYGNGYTKSESDLIVSDTLNSSW